MFISSLFQIKWSISTTITVVKYLNTIQYYLLTNLIFNQWKTYHIYVFYDIGVKYEPILYYSRWCTFVDYENPSRPYLIRLAKQS